MENEFLGVLTKEVGVENECLGYPVVEEFSVEASIVTYRLALETISFVRLLLFANVLTRK